MGPNGERAALVSGRHLYTEELEGRDIPEEDELGSGENNAEGNSQHHHIHQSQNILSQFHEDALTQVGMGSYQWLLCATTGFCFMADGVEVFITPYLETSIQAEMCISEEKNHWLSHVSLIGLLLGALLCPLADHIGRRTLLIFGLSVHLFFNIAAAFTTNFPLFTTYRLAGALGLGVCFPVACIYFAEFLPRNARGNIAALLLFWAFGGFYVIMFARAFLPDRADDDLMYESRQNINAWHRVLLLSSLPTLFALISICCLPESVRFLLCSGKDVSAIMMYQHIYKWNASKSAQYQLSELELPSKVPSPTPPPVKSVWAYVVYNISQFFLTLKMLGLKQHFQPFLLLSLIWGSLGFSYYGLSVYIPNRMQEITNERYSELTTIMQNLQEDGKSFNRDLENVRYVNVTFNSCTFRQMTLKNLYFENCYFLGGEFQNVALKNTFFKNSVFELTRFISNIAYSENFINCTFRNGSIDFSKRPPCKTELEHRVNRVDLMVENTVKLFCPFATILASAFCFSSVKRITLGVLGMVICSFFTLGCLFVVQKLGLLLFDFIWGFLFLFAFNAVNITSVEVFPVHLRATGFGLSFFWFRALGLCASAPASFVAPCVSAFMLFGGLAFLGLPDSSQNLM